MKLYFTYEFRNKINNKVYFGQTDNPKNRQKQHLRDAKYDGKFPIHRAISKYGIDNFDFNILSVFPTREEANREEIRLIELQQEESNCYNVARGGLGGHTMTKKQLEEQHAIKPNQYDALIKCLEGDDTLKIIASKFNTSDSSIRAWGERLGVNMIERGRKFAGKITLTQEQLDNRYSIPPNKYEEFKYHFDNGVSQSKMAEIFGVGINSVKGCAKRLGLSFNERRKGKMKDRVTPQIKKVSQAKYTPEERSKIWSETCVRNNKKRGLNKTQELEVEKLYFEDFLIAKEIGEKFSVPRSTIRGIINRAYKKMDDGTRQRIKKERASIVRRGERNNRYIDGRRMKTQIKIAA